MREQPSRFLKLWLILSAAALLAIAALNAWVDPFEAYRWAPREALGPHKMERNTRTAKAELVRHGPCRILFLGSSRTEMGIDPEHALWGDSATLNLALAATNFIETQAVFRYAVTRQPIERVVCFADFLMFSSRRDNGHDFKQSRFNPEWAEIPYHLQLLWSENSLDGSVQVLKNKSRDRRSGYGDRGAWIRDLNSNLLKRIGHRGMLRNIQLSFFKAGGPYHQYEYSTDRANCFRAMVEACRTNGIRLTVVIPPIHAIQLEAIRSAGLWDAFEQWKRDLTRIVSDSARDESGASPPELWDFTAYTGFNAEPFPPEGDTKTRMRWYWESSHFRMALGDLVLYRIHGQTPPDEPLPDDWGIRLTPQSVEARIEQLRRDQVEWMARNAGEVEFVARMRRESQKTE
ncbi:MAG: hypothetical protein HS116_22850 [Planctomycetes bacterium]|nr:hypothetical protein [Planctomycetota bacterium]